MQLQNCYGRLLRHDSAAPCGVKKRRFFPLFDMTVMLDMGKKKSPSLLSSGMLVALSGNNLTLHVFTYIIFGGEF